MLMTREQAETFAIQWARSWNVRDAETVLGHFAEDVVFTSPTALAVVGEPTIHGKDALRAYWTAALARIQSLHFTVGHVVWDPQRRDLAIVYTSVADGQTRRVAEHLRFNEAGQVIAGEVFHGIPGPAR